MNENKFLTIKHTSFNLCPCCEPLPDGSDSIICHDLRIPEGQRERERDESKWRSRIRLSRLCEWCLTCTGEVWVTGHSLCWTWCLLDPCIKTQYGPFKIKSSSCLPPQAWMCLFVSWITHVVVMISSLVLLINNTGPWYLKWEPNYFDGAQAVNFKWFI